MSRNSASPSGTKSLALRTGSVSCANFKRSAAVSFCCCIAGGRAEADGACDTHAASIIATPIARNLPQSGLLLLELPGESSNACGRFEVHVIVLVCVQLEKFLVGIERRKRLTQFIVTSGANEPAP